MSDDTRLRELAEQACKEVRRQLQEVLRENRTLSALVADLKERIQELERIGR